MANCCFRLLQIVLLVLVESYLYLWISDYQHFLKVVYITSGNLSKVAVSLCEIFCYVVFFYSFDTFMVSKRVTNYCYCFFVIFNFLFFWDVGWFSSARAFYDIYVMVIKNSYKFFYLVTILTHYAIRPNRLGGFRVPELATLRQL